MFTGIVASVGVVTSVSDHGAQRQLTITASGLGEDYVHGESIAVNGVCLTVAKHSGDEWLADVMRVTLEHTTLGSVAVGDRVNLERALRVQDRLGGHMVQGHVDGVATLVERDSQPDWEDFTFEVAPEVARYVVHKGSITFNGVSLTVASQRGNFVGVSLIPTTLSDTNLGALPVGATVNVEVDIFAKYVERFVGGMNE